MNLNDLTILGNPSHKATKKLETFPASQGVTRVTMTSDEVTARCPKTAQPDYYTIAITYVPNRACIESKSLKLYFETFREEGVFCEALAATICQDVVAACSPTSCRVEAQQKVRGGIAIQATAEYQGL